MQHLVNFWSFLRVLLGHVSADENEKEPEVQPTAVPQPEKKRRGPTLLPNIHARKPEERPIIVLNPSGQPIGPTSAIVKEFSRFLGTLVRDPNLAPLNYEYWHWLPAGTFNRIWAHVLRSYIVPEEGKRWVNATLNDLWRAYKCRIKKKHYKKYDTDNERWENRPDKVPKEDFLELLDFWNLPATQEESKDNKANRDTQKDMHTLGPKSLASLRQELKLSDPNKKPPTQSKVYKESRKRGSERKYKTDFKTIKENMEKLSDLEAEYELGDSQEPKDPYYEVIEKDEQKGRLRLRGRGVTKTNLKRAVQESYILPAEYMESIKSDLVSQIGPQLASTIITQFQAANPGMNLVVPDFHVSIQPRDSCSDPEKHQDMHNNLASVGTSTSTSNQMVEDHNEDGALLE